MAQLAYHVAAGMEFFNHKVTPASVLYLSLEDNLVRLQKRFSRMFGVEGNANLYLATKADSLNQGLEEQLTDFLQSKPATKLIIIDTLQKSVNSAVLPTAMLPIITLLTCSRK